MASYQSCLWLVADKTECGKPAVAKISVKGKVAKASIPVCAKHKAEHDENFAKLRVTGKR